MGSVAVEEFHSCAQISLPKTVVKDTDPTTDIGPVDHLALDSRKLWPNGYVLQILITGASPFVASKIQQFANTWSQYANIYFNFITSGNADIRVTVTPGGSWSYIGTDARGIAAGQPTMNFGWFNDQTADDEFSRVVIHEFGHALGCIHEQSSPLAKIPWNKPVVYAAYLKSDGWSPAQVDSNVFAVADQSTTVETAFDRTSIMEYPYDSSWTLDGSSAGWNRVLSDQDKKFIMQCYPKETIRRTTNDGVYFLNCFKDGQVSSGVAYYSSMGNNDGQQPTVYVDVTKGSLITWEGTPGSVTFPDGTKVSWNIRADAGHMTTFSQVGSANNGFENWNVYKDNYRVLYTIDGWQCYCVYWCF